MISSSINHRCSKDSSSSQHNKGALRQATLCRVSLCTCWYGSSKLGRTKKYWSRAQTPPPRRVGSGHETMRWMTRGQVIVSHAHAYYQVAPVDSRHLLVVVFPSLMFGKCYNFCRENFCRIPCRLYRKCELPKWELLFPGKGKPAVWENRDGGHSVLLKPCLWLTTFPGLWGPFIWQTKFRGLWDLLYGRLNLEDYGIPYMAD